VRLHRTGFARGTKEKKGFKKGCLGCLRSAPHEMESGKKGGGGLRKKPCENAYGVAFWGRWKKEGRARFGGGTGGFFPLTHSQRVIGHNGGGKKKLDADEKRLRNSWGKGEKEGEEGRRRKPCVNSSQRKKKRVRKVSLMYSS